MINETISEVDYNLLLKKQNGVCAMCGKDDGTLAVDYHPVNGKIRGILCSKCNEFLDLCRNDVKIIKSMIEYRNKWKF